jgi:hypothetical protein
MELTLVLFDKIFTTQRKYITILTPKEEEVLMKSGKYNVNKCYDKEHHVITRKIGEVKRAVKK